MSSQYSPEFLEEIRSLFVPGQEYTEEEIIRRVAGANGAQLVGSDMSIQTAVSGVIREAFPQERYEILWNRKQTGLRSLTGIEADFIISHRGPEHFNPRAKVPIYTTTMLVNALQG